MSILKAISAILLLIGIFLMFATNYQNIGLYMCLPYCFFFVLRLIKGKE